MLLVIHPDNMQLLHPEAEHEQGLGRACQSSFSLCSAQVEWSLSDKTCPASTDCIVAGPVRGLYNRNPCFQTVVNHSVKIWAHQHEHRPPLWTGSRRVSHVQPGVPSEGSTRGAWRRDPTQPLARLKATPAKANKVRPPCVQASVSVFTSFPFMFLMISL